MFPPDQVMATLAAFADTAAVLMTSDHGPVLELKSTLPGFDYVKLNMDHLDELVRRGWVSLDDPRTVGVTEAGVYWLKKWAGRRCHKLNVRR